MHVDDIEDVADDAMVDALIAGDISGADTQIVDNSIVAPIAISNGQWLIAAQSMGLVNLTETNAQATIAEYVRIGIKFDNTVRDNAKKMSIASKMGNMDDFIMTLPHDSALAHLKNAMQIADNLGLTDAKRKTAAADDNIVSGNKPKAKANTQAADMEESDPVEASKQQLRSSGSYSF